MTYLDYTTTPICNCRSLETRTDKLVHVRYLPVHTGSVWGAEINYYKDCQGGNVALRKGCE